MMTFKFALELGVECGLETVGDAVYNIRLRVGQLFEVDEYKNLINEANELNAKSDDKIEFWLEKLS